MIDVSVCIVSWNVLPFLRSCLQSLKKISRDVSFEVTVVDNASSDGSPRMVRESFPEVELIQNPENRGFAAACNRAMKKSRGRYILLLNPDAELTAGAVKEMVGFLDERPSAAAAGCRVLNPDGSLQPSVRNFPGFSSSLGQFTITGDLGFFKRARRSYFQRDFDYSSPAEVEQPLGAALFLRRSGVEKIDFMDENFFMFFEDVDICRRLKDSGYSIWYNPRASVIHRGGESTDQAEAQALFWFMQSQFYYFRKHRGSLRTIAFGLIFKPLYLIGLLWVILQNSVSFAASSLFRSSRETILRKKRRLRKKWRFLTVYFPRFCLSS